MKNRSYLMSFPMTFLFAYVVAVCVFPLLMKVTMALCVKEDVGEHRSKNLPG